MLVQNVIRQKILVKKIGILVVCISKKTLSTPPSPPLLKSQEQLTIS